MTDIANLYPIRIDVLLRWLDQCTGHQIFDPDEMKKDFPSDLVDHLTQEHDAPDNEILIGVYDLHFIEQLYEGFEKSSSRSQGSIPLPASYYESKTRLGQVERVRAIIPSLLAVLEKIREKRADGMIELVVSSRGIWPAGAGNHCWKLKPDTDTIFRVQDADGSVRYI